MVDSYLLEKKRDVDQEKKKSCALNHCTLCLMNCINWFRGVFNVHM